MNFVQYRVELRGFYAIATTFFLRSDALRVQRPINELRRIFLIRSSGMVARVTKGKGIKSITKRYSA